MIKAINSKKLKITPSSAVKTIIIYLLILLISFLFAFPCIWLILSAFNAEGDLLTLEGFFPTKYSFDTFEKLFTEVKKYDYVRWSQIPFLSPQSVASFLLYLSLQFPIRCHVIVLRAVSK